MYPVMKKCIRFWQMEAFWAFINRDIFDLSKNKSKSKFTLGKSIPKLSI